MSTCTENACPCCDGLGLPLGKLGRLTWHRCRNCGQTFHGAISAPDSPSQPIPGTAALALREQAQTLAAVSLQHLTRATRDKLLRNALSVNAYPTGGGGFVYVGVPKYDIPLESDLAALFELAEGAGVAWLKFDADAVVIHGVPLRSPDEAWS